MLRSLEPAVQRHRSRIRPRAPGTEPGLLTGLHPVREALRARRRTLLRLGLPGSPRPELEELRVLAREAGVPVVEGEDARRGPGAPGSWVWLEAGPLPELELEELVALPAGPGSTLIALDGVEDPQNVGAIFRSAEAAGASGLVLTRRHAPPLTDAVCRASAGASEWLPVARVPNLVRALRALKAGDWWILGAEPSAEVDLVGAPDAWLRGPRVIVLGAEGVGLRQGVREALDHRVRIPMEGRVASLNVSAACAVFLFEIRRREATSGTPETRCPRGDHNL
jgi:23S rRNA (guanosine2251-2'-O)-methyltransferase